ncbi:MAG TPA: DUF512 domain-containing protein [Syntrophomonadaceae bacterium]|nr:DUF512 domain-containing protein [Syntrophomonadaceae bacterium]
MLSVILRKTVREKNILPLTSTCNLRCIFCSNSQNPPGVEAFSLPPLPFPLVRQLIALLDPRRKIIIGEAASRFTEGEPLTHPDFWTVLSIIRRIYPETTIQITTNGSLLNRTAIKRLSDMQPLEINLSLNSATPRGRWLLMGDRRVNRVLEAADLMAEAGITYHGSIVAMPHLTGWQDLKLSCSFLQEHGAATVRIFLPGFTRLALPELRFDAEAMYHKLRQFLEEQAEVSNIPLLLEPFLWEDRQSLQVRVAGVIPGSPAERAGIRRGDVIKSVNGKPVKSRVDAFKRLYKPVHPCLELEGREFPVSFWKEKHDGAGIVMNYDLEWELVEKAGRVIREHRARNVLVLTSIWGLPWLQPVLPEWEGGGARVHLAAVPNRFFGGSIASAGLLTTLDFRSTLRQIIEKRGDVFDLVLLPGRAFDSGGRDLLGRHYSRLRGLTGGRVEIV